MSSWLSAILAISVSTISLFFLRKWAIRLRLVDAPYGRKSHNGHVPLVGGLATLLGLLAVMLFNPASMAFHYHNNYMWYSCILVAVGLIDDKLDIKASYRLVILTILAIWLVKYDGIALSYLGDFWGGGDVYLDNSALLFTTFSLIGCVTAFNMVDGIDGLLGVLAACAMTSLGGLFLVAGQVELATLCLIFICSMLPYVVVNIGLNVKAKYKVFMGDAGSFLVGFTVIWLLVFATQPVNSSLDTVAMRPVTALWIIAIPLMDMVLVMLKRAFKKTSQLKADRSHIHHVLMAFGFTPKQTLAIISLLAISSSAMAVIAEIYQVNESLMFSLFLQLFIGYSVVNMWLEKQTNRKAEHIA